MDAKLILSIYAAVISTVVFLWRLYEFYDDKRGKLKITLTISRQAVVYQNNNIGNWEKLLIATITNTGKHKRLFERPQIKLEKKVNGSDVFSVITLTEKTNFPFGLEPGEKFEYKMPLDEINEQFKTIGISKLKSLIQDTHGKTYLSKWIKI